MSSVCISPSFSLSLSVCLLYLSLPQIYDVYRLATSDSDMKQASMLPQMSVETYDLYFKAVIHTNLSEHLPLDNI